MGKLKNRDYHRMVQVVWSDKDFTYVENAVLGLIALQVST